MTVIYIDILFLINTAANCLLLFLTAKICDIRISLIRVLSACISGGLYSVLASIPNFSFLNSTLCKLFSALVIVFIAYGFQKSFIRIFAVFISVSAALGGIIYAVCLGKDGIFSPPGLKSLILSFICTSCVILSVFRHTGKTVSETHRINISFMGKSIEFTGFVDTGNNLRDPITGTPAIIISTKDLKTILPRDLYKIISSFSPADAISALSGTAYSSYFRLLPYSAVGVQNGIILAMRAEVKIDGKPSTKTLVALSPTNVSDGGTYTALMGV